MDAHLGVALAQMAVDGEARDEHAIGDFVIREAGGADAERIIGHGFSKIYCETPSNTSKGSTFSCAAKADDGNNYSFTATIVSSSRVEITDYEVVEPAHDAVLVKI